LKKKLPTDFSFLAKEGDIEPAAKVAKTTCIDALSDTDVELGSCGKLCEPFSDGKQKQSDCRKKPAANQQLRILGPEIIQTLRGNLLGRDVAIVLCGESHEDAIDLSRPEGILDPQRGWVETRPMLAGATDGGFLGFDPSEAVKTKYSVSLAKAKEWAARVVDDESEDDEDGSVLVFEEKVGTDLGVARVFSNDTKASSKHRLPANATVYKWCDSDTKARDYNTRRLEGDSVSTEELDALIAERKQERLDEGLQLFDDWFFQQCEGLAGNAGGNGLLRVDLILENQVPPSELELHVEPGVNPAPPAHECLKAIEPDSDEESDAGEDPDDGCGTFADYLLRRARARLPADRVHCVDPRDLGNPEDAAENSLLQELLSEPLPRDLEQAELEASGVKPMKCDDDKMKSKKTRGGKVGFRMGHVPGEVAQPMPSWEAYFGTVAGILYYSPHVKVDYVPLLARCLDSPQKLTKFFDTLYFGTVPDAVSQMGLLTDETRSLTRTRALTHRPSPGADLVQRSHDEGLVPLKAAPVDRYLKARGSFPPRTWVSGLGAQVREGGLGDLVDAAQSWMTRSVLQLLTEKGDETGDYFVQWLREAHREIWNQVDRSDPSKLRNAKIVASEKYPFSKKPEHKFNLEDICIPDIEAAFAEIAQFDTEAGRASTRRQRVLAKFVIDAFQLRLVDLSAILKMAHIATTTPEGGKCVIVFYAGSDHTKNVRTFFEEHGFSSAGLPAKGVVGKGKWKGDESRGLKMPAYLQDFRRLFSSATTKSQSRRTR
jgi:hypothetical protein